MRRSTLFTVLVMSALSSLGGCGGDARVRCLPGDQTQCRCPGAPDGGASYGYRTCQAVPDGGADYGSCDCVVGLLPNRGSPLSTPYMSGMGSGNGADAGSN